MTVSQSLESAAIADPPRATARDWIGLAVIALPCLLYSMDLTILNLAVPHLTADLRPTASQLLWIMDIYGFMVAGALVTMGTLGDRIGRRRMLMIGATAFGAVSILAAFARSAEMLIAARALLGIAAATLAPSTLSLIRNMFLDDRQRTFAIGIWIASYSAGAALGPVIGGLILSHFSWGMIFLVSVPVMVLILILGPMLLPEFRDPTAERIDLASAALSLVAVLAVIYGIKRIAEYGPGWMAAGAILGGIAVGVAFVHRQRTVANPLMDLRLFQNRAFSVSLMINVLGIFIAVGSFLLIAQYLQLVAGMSPLEAGLWLAPTGVALAIGSLLTPWFVSRFPRAYVLALGFLIVAIGFAVVSQVSTSSSIAVLMGAVVFYCFGFAPVGAITTDLIVSSAPPERAGIASAMSETAAEFGGAVGIAVLGSIVTAIYRNLMADMALGKVPPEAVTVARETIGGAVAVSQQLPVEVGNTLLSAAQVAFTQSMGVTAGICASLAVVMAGVVVVTLRR